MVDVMENQVNHAGPQFDPVTGERLNQPNAGTVDNRPIDGNRPLDGTVENNPQGMWPNTNDPNALKNQPTSERLPKVSPVDESHLTGDQLQARTVKRLPDEKKQEADKAAKAARKEASVKLHADRLKAGKEHAIAQADKLWVGTREVTIERAAVEDDIGFTEDDACSVVKYVDTQEEGVVADSTITNHRVGAPVVYSH